jgi:hypothetical protein
MPFIFYRYGAQIRARGKYAKQAAEIAEMMKQRALRQRELEKKDPAPESA